MSEQMKNLIDEKLKNYEDKKEQKISYPESEVKTLRDNIDLYAKVADLSLEEMSEINRRFELIAMNAKKDEEFVSNVSPKKLSIKEATKKFLNSKKGVSTLVTIGATLGLVSCVACGAKNEDSKSIEPTEIVSEVDTETPEEVIEAKVIPTSMSEEIQEFADTTVLSVDDALTSGINLSLSEELTEADKETYATVLAQYRIVTNMDDITKLQYAELFGEMSNPTEDLINNFTNYNTQIKKHLITVSSDNLLDYSQLYNNKKDAEVLNYSEDVIAKMNDASTDKERLAAAKEWYSYAANILTSAEGNIALSSQALDTLITHSEAHDQLTRSRYASIQGAHIDDELEHKFNVAKDVCLGISNESNIEVEEIGIENLKSTFRISMIEKLNTKYEDAISERELQLSIGNTLNSYNTYDEVISYVESKIDLSKYEVSSIEKQKNEKGINAPAQKSKHDSGVSDGQGGVISTEQFSEYKVNPSAPNAREQVEDAVQKADEVKSDSSDSHTLTNPNGEVVAKGNEVNTEEYNKGVQDGANARNDHADLENASSYRNAPSGSTSYSAGWYYGWDQADAAIKKAISETKFNGSSTFEQVDGDSTIIEEDNTYDYTEKSFENQTDNSSDQNNVGSEQKNDSDASNIKYDTTYVPIDSNSNTSSDTVYEESEEEYDYTTPDYSLPESTSKMGNDSVYVESTGFDSNSDIPSDTIYEESEEEYDYTTSDYSLLEVSSEPEVNNTDFNSNSDQNIEYSSTFEPIEEQSDSINDNSVFINEESTDDKEYSVEDEIAALNSLKEELLSNNFEEEVSKVK